MDKEMHAIEPSDPHALIFVQRLAPPLQSKAGRNTLVSRKSTKGLVAVKATSPAYEVEIT